MTSILSDMNYWKERFVKRDVVRIRIDEKLSPETPPESIGASASPPSSLRTSQRAQAALKRVHLRFVMKVSSLKIANLQGATAACHLAFVHSGNQSGHRF